MPYTFKMMIHGVVALVKHASEEKYTVVVPNTMLSKPHPGPARPTSRRRAADKEPLVRHECQMSFGAGGLTPRGHEIVFGFPNGAPAAVKRQKSVDKLPQLRTIAGDDAFCKMHDDYRTGTDPNRVTARFTVDRGTLSSASHDASRRMGIGGLPIIPGGPGPGQPGREQAGLNNVLIWTVEGLSGPLVVEARPLGPHATGATLNIPAPISGGVHEAFLINDRSDAELTDIPQGEDPDFRWYFEMVKGHARLKKHYPPYQDLPFPRGDERKRMPFSTADKGAPVTVSGQNCHPCEFCP